MLAYENPEKPVVVGVQKAAVSLITWLTCADGLTYL